MRGYPTRTDTMEDTPSLLEGEFDAYLLKWNEYYELCAEFTDVEEDLEELSW